MSSNRQQRGVQETRASYGFHTVEAIIEQQRDRIESVVIDKQRVDQRIKSLIKQIENQQIPYRYAHRDEMDSICNGGNHQGVAVFLIPRKTNARKSLEDILDCITNGGLLLVLDHIQDPHNLGACLRTAECAGVDAVLIPKDGASPVNDTVRKVASGAAENPNIITITNVAQTLKKLQDLGYWIIGATDQGDKTLYDCEFTGNIVIVMGSEGKGMKRLTAEHCDFLAKIPMQGNVSSLNVSVATGIFLFEATRQRNKETSLLLNKGKIRKSAK